MEVKEDNNNLFYDTKRIELYDKKPVVYIYNTDNTSNSPVLKIGYTTNIKNLITEYKKLYEYGKFELCLETKELSILNDFICVLLEDYKVSDENYQLEIGKAQGIIVNLVNIINLSSNKKRV
jgi:hypothetical protein